MTKLATSIETVFYEFSKYVGWLPGLLSRIVVGSVFAEAGWGKFHHMEKVIGYFTSLGIPAAQYQAPFVAGVELICGSLFLVGCFSRLASIPLMIIMGVALMTAKRAEIHGLTELFAIYEFVYIVVLSWVCIKGPGGVSLDRFLFKSVDSH